MDMALTLDVATQCTGWAAWDLARWNACVPPFATGIIHVRIDDRTGDIMEKGYQLMRMMAGLKPVREHNLVRIIEEFPIKFGDAKGYAADKQGHTYAMACCCGFIGAWALDKGILCEPVGVNKWKGQLSKEQTIARIRKVFHDSETNVCLGWKHDVWDAVGIGLHAKGWFGEARSKKTPLKH